jgi:hypothetical protein
MATPTGLLAPLPPSLLNEGDRVRVLWGPGVTFDGTVTDTTTELRKGTSVDKAQVQYDDGDKAWLADGDGWTIWRLSAAAAPLDDDAPPARRRRRRQGRAPPAAAADDDDAPPAAAGRQCKLATRRGDGDDAGRGRTRVASQPQQADEARGGGAKARVSSLESSDGG